MTTTPLPPLPDTLIPGHYNIVNMKAYAQQARADLEAEVARLREALQVLVDNGGIGPEWMFDDARAALESKP